MKGKTASDVHSREDHFKQHKNEQRSDLHLMPGANGKTTNAATKRHPTTIKKNDPM